MGFSGGKDSVTLFYLLKELTKDMSFHFFAAYFNHRLRKDAGAEEQWVKDFCEKQDVELASGSKDVIAFMKENKLNLEHAASLSRYRFFQELSSMYKNAKVATAHTKSDLTETFFIKLFRGSGLQGLSSIFSRKENYIIRPLLLFSQEEILSFIRRNQIDYYKDPSNEEDEFLRNKIRHHVIPAIERIEPDINQRVFQTVSIIQEEYEYLSDDARFHLELSLLMGKILPVDALYRVQLAVQRHIIREYIRLLKGNLLNIGFDHIEAIRTQCEEKQGLAIPGIELKFRKGYIFPADLIVPDYNYQVKEPGKLRIREIRKKLEVKELKVFRKPEDNDYIIVPADRVQFPLTVRSPQRGDKYQKINTTIEQKVFEMIRASGIPAELRNLCPVVLNGDGRIIWTVDSPVAEAFKVTDKDKKTKKLLKLSIPLYY